MTRKYYKPAAAEHRQPPPNAITLSDAIRDYLADCRTYRHLADSTVRRYEVSLRQFARPLLAREKYVEVRYVPREAWVAWVMETDHLSNKAFNSRRSHLSAFKPAAELKAALRPLSR